MTRMIYKGVLSGAILSAVILLAYGLIVLMLGITALFMGHFLYAFLFILWWILGLGGVLGLVAMWKSSPINEDVRTCLVAGLFAIGLFVVTMYWRFEPGTTGYGELAALSMLIGLPTFAALLGLLQYESSPSVNRK